MLDELIRNAPAALHQAVQIGRFLKLTDAKSLLPTVDKIQAELGYRIDGRLAMQYAVSLSCTEKVTIDLVLVLPVLYYIILLTKF